MWFELHLVYFLSVALASSVYLLKHPFCYIVRPECVSVWRPPQVPIYITDVRRIILTDVHTDIGT